MKTNIEDYISVFKPGPGSKVTKLPTKGLMNMTLGSAAFGPSSSRSEAVSIRPNIEDTRRELVERAHKVGLVPEIRDIIESLDESRRILTKKNFELNILETLAMESDDQNISDLREQLFTTVKLVHQDLVNEIMISEYRDDALESGFDDSVKIDMGRDALHHKVRRWFYKRKEMRGKLKQYKKNLKTKMNIEGY